MLQQCKKKKKNRHETPSWRLVSEPIGDRQQLVSLLHGLDLGMCLVVHGLVAPPGVIQKLLLRRLKLPDFCHLQEIRWLMWPLTLYWTDESKRNLSSQELDIRDQPIIVQADYESDIQHFSIYQYTFLSDCR